MGIQFNKCNCCGASNGRAGLLLSKEGKYKGYCINCSKTFDTGKMCLNIRLNRTDE